MQINQYPIEATFVPKLSFFDIDQRLSPGVYQSQKISADNVLGSFLSYMPEILENMYNTSASLTGNRTVDQNGFDLMFMNGKFNIGTTGFVNTFKLEINSPQAGVIVFNTTGSSFSGNTANGRIFTGSTINGVGVSLLAPFNDLYDVGSSPATPDPSILFDVRSVIRGSRPFPRQTKAEIEAIPTPANGLMTHNTDTEYPEMNHPVYGWQSIGYGEIRLTIDFSVTPLNAGNSYKISIPCLLPLGKVIHKIVLLGTGVDETSSLIQFGADSDIDYFIANTTDINSDAGSVSIGNSKRTTSINENFNIEGNDSVMSGTLDILICHT